MPRTASAASGERGTTGVAAVVAGCEASGVDSTAETAGAEASVSDIGIVGMLS